jgi:hypothetical protein
MKNIEIVDDLIMSARKKSGTICSDFTYYFEVKI